MSTDILSLANEEIRKSKIMLTQELPAAEFEVQRDALYDTQSAVKQVYDSCEEKIDDLKKQKRAIDDKIADIRKEQRPYKLLLEDLKEYARRLNNQFWSVKRELSGRGL